MTNSASIPMDGPGLLCEGLVKIYETEGSRVQAVRGVDLRIPAGVIVAVSGPSGSGKSSLLRMISGLSEPTAGEVTIGGVNLWAMGRRRRRRERCRLVVHVEQHPSDNLLPHLSVRDQVARVALRRRGDADSVEAILTELGLSNRLDHFPDTLSGGEQQRLAFARAAVASATVVIADEPTAELDTASAHTVLDAARTLADRGATVVIATHDPRVVERVDTIVELRDGAVASLTGEKGRLAVIDGAGRLQLPPPIREQFEQDSARLIWVEDGGYLRVERP